MSAAAKRAEAGNSQSAGRDARPRPSGTRIPALSARLARLACDVDELAQQIIVETLTERDELFLAAPTAHLAIALEWLEQALYECDGLDLTQSWAASLRAGEDRATARTNGIERRSS